MLAAAVAVYVVGLRRGDATATVYDDDGLQPPVASLPPVLLPEKPQAADVDKLRFALGLRGYRMDQVDEVLDALRDEISAKDQTIADLRAELLGAPPATTSAAAPAGDSAPGSDKAKAEEAPAASGGELLSDGATEPSSTGARND